MEPSKTIVNEPPKSKADITEINDRTMHEIDYLKYHVGPILIAALSEICTHRPADPIEYLGYWLLRYRYNEELKRRDVLNTMEAIHLKWTLGQDPRSVLEGFTQDHPAGPPGYGGPINPDDVIEEPGEDGEQLPPKQEEEYGGEVDYYDNMPEDGWGEPQEEEEEPEPVEEEQLEPSYIEELPVADGEAVEGTTQEVVGEIPAPAEVVVQDPMVGQLLPPQNQQIGAKAAKP